MKPHAAFGGIESQVVLNTIALEGFHATTASVVDLGRARVHLVDNPK